MAKTHAKVEGLKPVLRRLEKLPERSRRHAMRPAVRKASTPIRKAAKKLIPRGTREGTDNYPPLNKTLKTVARWHKPSETIYAVTGPELKKAPHSFLVHDGTQPHEIILSQPVQLSNGVFLPAGFAIQHPGARAQPFMTEAVEATRSKSHQILKKSILENIDKQVKKLAKTR